MQRSANILWIRRLVWTYFLLLLFEGVLRKWVVPSLSNPLLLVRAPIVIVIYALAIHARVFPYNRWVMSCCLLAFVGLFAGLYVLQDAPVVALFGFQADFLHLPLIFVMPRVLDLRDVRQFGFWTLVFSIPMALLMVLQFQAAPTSVLNAGAAGSVNGQISAALGHIRPAGTFTFISGPAAFFPFVAAFLLIGPFLNLNYPRWLQTASLLALIVGAGVSSSRSLAAAVGIVIACAIVGGTILQPFLVSQRVIIRIAQGAVLLAIVGFAVSHLPVFNAGLETFSARVATASGGEASTGGFTGRIISGYTGPIELLAKAPLLGSGLGLGTNAGSALVNAGEVKYMLAEDEWSRVLLESGPVIGGAYLLLRVGLVVWLVWVSIKMGQQRNVLPFLLLGCCAPSLVSGQFGQPTELGFAVFGGGLTLAAMHLFPTPQNQMDNVSFTESNPHSEVAA